MVNSTKNILFCFFILSVCFLFSENKGFCNDVYFLKNNTDYILLSDKKLTKVENTNDKIIKSNIVTTLDDDYSTVYISTKKNGIAELILTSDDDINVFPITVNDKIEDTKNVFLAVPLPKYEKKEVLMAVPVPKDVEDCRLPASDYNSDDYEVLEYEIHESGVIHK